MLVVFSIPGARSSASPWLSDHRNQPSNLAAWPKILHQCRVGILGEFLRCQLGGESLLRDVIREHVNDKPEEHQEGWAYDRGVPDDSDHELAEHLLYLSLIPCIWCEGFSEPSRTDY